MSISNRHQFAPLTKDTKPFTGQRIARVIAKAAKDGSYNPNLQQSLAISIPVLNVEDLHESLPALLPHLLGLVKDTQDAIIGEMRKETGCTEIADEDISVAAVVKYLEENSGGSRVTSEYLASWFKDTYSLAAAEFIIEMCKWNCEMEELSPEQQAVIEQKTNVLCDMFTGFASGKYSPAIPKCKAIVNFGKFVAEMGDSRMVMYVEKAAKIQKEKEAELSADALGF